MKTENRFIKQSVETRTAEQDGHKYIEGKIKYNIPSESMYLGYTVEADREVITRTAFKKSLGDKRTVLLNYNHNQDEILGSTKSGTLELFDEEDGLSFRCLLPNTQTGIKTWETINRKDCNSLSFEFIPRNYHIENGISYVDSCQLEAISVCVPYAAYPNATDSFASIRSQFQKRSIDIEAVGTILETGKIDTENPNQIESLKNLSEALNKILQPQSEKKVEAVSLEQPESIPADNTKKPEPEIDPEKVQRLEEIQKEILEELKEIK